MSYCKIVMSGVSILKLSFDFSDQVVCRSLDFRRCIHRLQRLRDLAPDIGQLLRAKHKCLIGFNARRQLR